MSFASGRRPTVTRLPDSSTLASVAPSGAETTTSAAPRSPGDERNSIDRLAHVHGSASFWRRHSMQRARLHSRKEETMYRLGKTFIIALILVAAPAAALAASSPLAGTWRKLPAAPVAVEQSLTGVWTGKQLIVFGRTPAMNPSANVAEAYNPATSTWNRLSPPRGPDAVPGYRAVWTGK